MAVHELTTNAAKYGALSVPGGVVEVTWSGTDASDSGFQIDWIEKKGPPVTAPTRSGFGSQLMKRALTHQIGADAQIDYLSGGLRAHIPVPLSAARSHPLDSLQS